MKPKPSWECPVECPHQSDDKLLNKLLGIYKNWLDRYRLFLLVLVAVGLMTFSIVIQEKRRPTNVEFVSGLALLIISLEKPALLAQFALKQIGEQKS